MYFFKVTISECWRKSACEAAWFVPFNKYYWGDKWRRMRWVWHVACMKEKKNAYKILVRKPEGKRPIERPTHTWEDIKVDLKDKGWKGGECISVVQRQTRCAVGMVMNFQVLGNTRDLNFWLTVSFLWRHLFHVVRYYCMPLYELSVPPCKF